MSDFNSSLPVRTQTNGDIVASLADGTTPSQLAAIDTHGSQQARIADAGGNVTTSQANGTQRALDVGINVLGVQVDPRAIRNLTAADVATAAQGAAAALSGAWPMELTDGTNKVGVAPASTAAAAAQPAAVVALSPNSPLPAGTNALGSVLANMQVANAPVTVANPVPVTITSASSGTPIQQYLTFASLAAGGSTTLTYIVPATHTFSLERIWATASGKIKVIVQWGVSGSPTTYFVGFNSTATPNIDIPVTAPPTLAAAQVVNVVITNEDKNPFDVYATVEGNQIS